MKIAWDDNPIGNGSILVKRQVYQFLARGHPSLIQLYIVGVIFMIPVIEQQCLSQISIMMSRKQTRASEGSCKGDDEECSRRLLTIQPILM